MTQHTRQEIADIVMGEITRAGYRSHASWPSLGDGSWSCEETCAALSLADSVVEELLKHYHLIEKDN